MASESGQNFTPIYTRKIEELTMKTSSPRDKRTPLVCLMHTLRETPELSPELSVDSAGVLGSMALLVNQKGTAFHRAQDLLKETHKEGRWGRRPASSKKTSSFCLKPQLDELLEYWIFQQLTVG